MKDIHLDDERMSEVSEDTEKELLTEGRDEESTLAPETEEDEVQSVSVSSVPAPEPMPSTSSALQPERLDDTLSAIKAMMEMFEKKSEQREAAFRKEFLQITATRGSQRRLNVKDLPSWSEVNPWRHAEYMPITNAFECYGCVKEIAMKLEDDKWDSWISYSSHDEVFNAISNMTNIKINNLNVMAALCVKDLKIHLEELQVESLEKAAIVADEYSLTHKIFEGKNLVRGRSSKEGFQELKSGKSKTENASDLDKSVVAPVLKGSSLPSGQRMPIKCFNCGKLGHRKADCWSLRDGNREHKPVALVSRVSADREINALSEGEKSPGLSDLERYKSFVSYGSVATESGKGRRGLVILRDTGALQSLILKRALPEGFEYEGKEKVLIKSFPKEIISCPYETVVLQSDYATGPVRVAVVEEIPVEGVDLILANDIGGNRVLSNPRLLSYPQSCASTESLEGEFPGIFPMCAITRSRRKLEASRDSKIDFSKCFLGKFGDCSQQGKVLAVSREKFIKDQENDLELAEIAAKAFSDKEIENIPVGYYVENGLLMRKFRTSKVAADEEWEVNYQIVVPPNYRPSILHLAHQNPFSGHFGVNKTFCKLTKHFYWPGIHSDVKEFCKTCHVCQMIGKPNQKLSKAPLEPIPAMEEPFHRVLVDIVGPLPKSKGGNQYILTIMDRSTRYPEAIPLRNVCSKNVVNGMLQFFTRFGLPKEVQSDQGSNFLSNVFRQAMQELGIRQVTSSAYHPQSQGAVERYHQTLKTMLKKFCLENKSDWDKGLPFLLFASREIPNESLGFSPFELVFCHQVRGPLKFIKDQWINNVEDSNLLDYVSDSRERIRKTWDIARDNLMEAQQKMKKYYDLGAKKVDYKPGNEVLVFLPVAGQPLHAKFSGPYIIEKKVGNTDYVVLTPDRRRKKRLCHVNMLKPYFSRTPKPVLLNIKLDDNSNQEKLKLETEVEDWPISNSEALRNLKNKLVHLDGSRGQELSDLFYDYKDVFSDVPGRTCSLQHDVDVGNSNPIKQHPYRLNPQKAEIVEREVKYMLDHKLIEHSSSQWSSPVVLVKKNDGQYRLCFDYRKVNAVTRTDSFPIPRVDDCIDRIGKARFISKFDMLKGYWQEQ
ncbi:uncharacterized protein [Palaemon carinicauda]|uniref:uncharacterized protein n=1 Tax=Palaemon carinicauda TaxID=392227 RepID=UPI0035B6988E